MTTTTDAPATLADLDEALTHLSVVPYRRINNEAYTAWVRQADKWLDQRFELAPVKVPTDC